MSATDGNPVGARTLFAIRDDDTSGWTHPDELESVYREVWKRGIPASLSVVPQAVQSHYPEDRERFYQGEERKPIHDNADLVSFLKPLIAAGHVHIMLHGFDHSYRVSLDEGSPANLATEAWTNQLRATRPGPELVWLGESAWKDATTLSREIEDGKKYLESELACRIRVFVPPSNQIGVAGVRALQSARLDLSGTMGRGGDRPLTAAYASAYVRRWIFRIAHGEVYPHVLNLGGHKELVAHAMTRTHQYDDIRRSLASCFRRAAPFVVAVHYWELCQNRELHGCLMRLCDDALEMGYTPATVAACFEES